MRRKHFTHKPSANQRKGKVVKQLSMRFKTLFNKVLNFAAQQAANAQALVLKGPNGVSERIPRRHQRKRICRESQLSTIPREEIAATAKRQSLHALLLGMGVISITLTGVATWLVLAPIEGAVIGHGEVQVVNKRKTVQHQEGGIIAAVHVREGQQVASGDKLIELIDKSVESQLAVLQTRLNAVRVKKARLQAEQQMKKTFTFADDINSRIEDSKLALVLSSEKQSFQAHRKILMTQLRLIDSQISDAESEIDGLTREIAQTRRAHALLKKEINNASQLMSQGFVTKNQVTRLKRSSADYKAQLENRRTQLTRAMKKIISFEIQKEEIRAHYVNAASETLATLESEEQSLQEQLTPLSDRLVRQSVRAPVAGKVLAMEPLHPGSVLASGGRILDIVPSEEILLVNARVALSDVDELYAGQQSEIRFTAFPTRKTPTVRGTVSHVSADRLIDKSNDQSFYEVEVAVDMTSLEQANLPQLHPGMPATVYTKTQKRTMLDYILDPLINFHEQAMRET